MPFEWRRGLSPENSNRRERKQGSAKPQNALDPIVVRTSTSPNAFNATITGLNVLIPTSANIQPGCLPYPPQIPHRILLQVRSAPVARLGNARSCVTNTFQLAPKKKSNKKKKAGKGANNGDSAKSADTEKDAVTENGAVEGDAEESEHDAVVRTPVQLRTQSMEIYGF